MTKNAKNLLYIFVAILVLLSLWIVNYSLERRKEIKIYANKEKHNIQENLKPFSDIGAQATKQTLCKLPVRWVEPDSTLDIREYKGNTLIYHLENINQLYGDYIEPPLLVAGDQRLNTVADLVTTGKWPGRQDIEWVKLIVQDMNIKRYKYLLIIRTHQYIKPKEISDDNFMAGAFTGDLLLYRTKDKALIACLPINAKGADSFFLKKTNGPVKGMKIVEDFDAVAQRNMWSNVTREIYFSLFKMFPKSPLPYEWHKDVKF